MTADERDDAALAACALAGEDHAFAALMARYKGGLYRFIRRYVGDAEEAYDLLQETFVAAWSSLSRFDRARPMSAWLRRIALNKCRDWSRRRLVRKFFYAAEPLDTKLEERLPSQDDAGAENDEANLRRLDLAVAGLPTSLKEPLLLTAFEGLSHREAASILGISAKAVETRIHRAKAALARQLADKTDIP